MKLAVERVVSHLLAGAGWLIVACHSNLGNALITSIHLIMT